MVRAINTLTPYLVRIDGQTGDLRSCISTEALEQNVKKWKGHNLEKVIEKLNLQTITINADSIERVK